MSHVLRGLAGVQFLSGAAEDGTQDVDGFFVAFPVAYGQLWWLGSMLLAILVGTLVRPWLTQGRAIGSTLVVFAASLVAWGWTGPWLFEEGVALPSFFWVGVLAGRVGLRRLTTSTWTPWVVGVGIALGVALPTFADPMPPGSWIGPRTASAIALGVVTSSALCAGALALSGLLARTPLARPLGLLGERSFEIFLGHLVVLAATRGALGVLGVESLVVQIPVGIVTGLSFPLALWWMGRRVGLPWLFTSPGK